MNAETFTKAVECETRCQYAVDVSMPGYVCVDECQYAERPCPACFESSGYMARYIPATWYEPAWEDTDYSVPCEHCDGTGIAPRPSKALVHQPSDIADDIAF